MIGTSPLHVQVIDGLLLSNQHGMDLGLYFLPILGLGPFYCQIIKRVGRFHFNQKGLVQNSQNKWVIYFLQMRFAQAKSQSCGLNPGQNIRPYKKTLGFRLTLPQLTVKTPMKIRVSLEKSMDWLMCFQVQPIKDLASKLGLAAYQFPYQQQCRPSEYIKPKWAWPRGFNL